MPVTWLETRELALADLARYPGNPRRGDVAAIAASLYRHGQYRSLVVLGGQLVILAGNHTSDALALLYSGWLPDGADPSTTWAGRPEVARCEIVACTDDEARRINLADNRLAELGGYDSADLAAMLAALDGDYAGTGWADEDYQALLEPEPPSNNDPDDAPEPPEDPVTRPGDIWQLGPHRLICGDATDLAAVDRLLEGGRCDAMWTDPPYGVEYVGKTKDALTIRNDGAAGLPELIAGALAVATSALRPGAPVYIAHPDTFRATFEQAMRDAGWLFRQNLVWVKNAMVLGRSDYHYRHEPVLYGSTPDAEDGALPEYPGRHEPVLYGFTPGGKGRLGRGGDRWQGDNAQTTVFEVDKPARSEQHPTMKPVALITGMLANSLPLYGLVYDPFGGSGSTLIAAHHMRAKARLVELDPRFCDVICQRYQDHTGVEPVRL